MEGWRGVFHALAGDVPVLQELAAGRAPAAWKPLETTTEEEATFLAPLDPVSARGRAKVLFDFDYVWEVYKPEHQRRYGYYALPVLWGDRLVARFDSRMDRQVRRLVLHGLWLEEETLAADEAFSKPWQPVSGASCGFWARKHCMPGRLRSPGCGRGLEH